jgi:site-specific recombinase XerD
MRKKPESQSYKGGHIRQTPQGWIADVRIDGKRLRHRATSKEKCEEWIREQTVSAHLGVSPLTPAELLMYREACKLLPPGMSLLDAANHARSVVTPTVVIGMDEAVSQFLDDREAAGLRRTSIDSARWSLRKLARATQTFPDTARLESYLPRDKHPITRNNIRRVWYTFFEWCKARHYVASNPAAGISQARVDETIPGILSVPQARLLLGAAWIKDQAFARFFALSMFAGLRNSEAVHLRWDDVGEVITIRPEVAKKRRARYVQIMPNLRDWLAGCPKEGRVFPWGPIWQVRLAIRLRRQAGITVWPKNALRHSFASYHLALGHDWARTAFELGHGSGTDILARHYRQLVTEAQAKEYFELRPEECAQSVPEKCKEVLIDAHNRARTCQLKTA